MSDILPLILKDVIELPIDDRCCLDTGQFSPANFGIISHNRYHIQEGFRRERGVETDNQYRFPLTLVKYTPTNITGCTNP